jgi:RNA polymerase sigma factor (sigma-70 family)
MRGDGALESDEALMQRYANGDVQAFELLYRRHELKVWRFLCRSVRNPATADELLQDVWFAVVESAARYQVTARFTTWLFTIAHRKLVDGFRRSRAIRALEPVEDLIADASHEPGRQAESDQHTHVLLAAIEQLPDEQRNAFLLQAEGDLSIEEIARATDTSFETAKSRLRYARSKLRRLLQEHA